MGRFEQRGRSPRSGLRAGVRRDRDAARVRARRMTSAHGSLATERQGQLAGLVPLAGTVLLLGFLVLVGRAVQDPTPGPTCGRAGGDRLPDRPRVAFAGRRAARPVRVARRPRDESQTRIGAGSNHQDRPVAARLAVHPRCVGCGGRASWSVPGPHGTQQRRSCPEPARAGGCGEPAAGQPGRWGSAACSSSSCRCSPSGLVGLTWTTGR